MAQQFFTHHFKICLGEVKGWQLNDRPSSPAVVSQQEHVRKISSAPLNFSHVHISFPVSQVRRDWQHHDKHLGKTNVRYPWWRRKTPARTGKSLLMLGQIGGDGRLDWVQRDVTWSHLPITVHLATMCAVELWSVATGSPALQPGSFRQGETMNCTSEMCSIDLALLLVGGLSFRVRARTGRL